MTSPRCPRCGTEGKDPFADRSGDLWAKLGCSVCGLELTPEGLLVEGNREIGKKDVLIHEVGESLETLLKRVAQLENHAQQIGKVVDIETAGTSWNAKTARRRVRRWVFEHDNKIPPIRDEDLRKLIQRIMAEGETPLGDRDDILEQYNRYWSNGLWLRLEYYERRKMDEPMLILADELPKEIRSAFLEARECYRWGLFTAAVGFCRVILENVVKLTYELRRDSSWPSPIDDSFHSLVNCLPDKLLSVKERERVKEIRRQCNDALHNAAASFSEYEAWLALSDTVAIVTRLVNSGGLK